MGITTRGYRFVILYASCFIVSVMIVCGIGILSNVGNHAVDAVLTDTPEQAQTVKVAVVGMFNKVTIGQTQTSQPAVQHAPDRGGLFGLSSIDYAILAVFMALLAVFVITASGAWLFFSPKGW